MARSLPALRTTLRLPGLPSRRMAIAGLAAALVAATALLYRPAAAAGDADGVFANDCCGTLELRRGRLLLNGKQATRYSLGRDARGPYILPRTYVGGLDPVGFEVDGTRRPTRLRLDRLPRPTRILLREERAQYLFTRREPRPPR